MSKDAFYFPHDSNARNDQRILKIRMKYGMEGYGIYFSIVEILREQEDYILSLNEFTTIAFDLRVEYEVIEDIILNYNLFELKDDIFYSRSLKRRLECMDEKKKKRVEAGRLGGIASAKIKQKPTNAKALNKTKLNKTKENDINKKMKEFEIHLQSFINNYDTETLDEFFNYWTEPNKSNTKMKFELQPTWDTKRRLQRWAGNDFNSNKTNGVSGFKKDANGKFWMGYCSKCNISDFYDDIGIKQDSKCCQSKLMPEKKKSA